MDQTKKLFQSTKLVDNKNLRNLGDLDKYYLFVGIFYWE